MQSPSVFTAAESEALLPNRSRIPWFPSGVLRVFTRPRELFATFCDDAPWAGALVVSIAVGIITIIALPDQILYEGMQGATTRRGVPVEITSSPAVVAIFERVRLSMGVMASQPLLAVMFAGIMMFVFGTVLRWRASFRQYFAVAAHAFLISAAGALVSFAVQLSTGAWQWTPTLHGVLGTIGIVGPAFTGAINPFTVWMLVALGIGVATVNGNRRAVIPVAVLLAAYVGLAATVLGPGL